MVRLTRMPARMSGLADGSAILKITARRDIAATGHLVQPRLDGREAMNGRKQHRPDRAESDHEQRHRLG